MLIQRKRLEDAFLAVLSSKVITEENILLVFKNVAAKIKEHFGHIPEELRLKRVALTQEEGVLNNYVRFIGEGRSSATLAEAILISEKKIQGLKDIIESLEYNQKTAFEPPPIEWIRHKLENLREVLETKTEASALALREVFGPISLKPIKPEVGRAGSCPLKVGG